MWWLFLTIALAAPPHLSGVGRGTTFEPVPRGAERAQAVGDFGLGVAIGAAPLVAVGRIATLVPDPARPPGPPLGARRVDAGATALAVGVGGLTAGAALALGGGLAGAHHLRRRGVRKNGALLAIGGLALSGAALASLPSADDPVVPLQVAGLGAIGALAGGVAQLGRNQGALAEAHLPVPGPR